MKYILTVIKGLLRVVPFKNSTDLFVSYYKSLKFKYPTVFEMLSLFIWFIIIAMTIIKICSFFDIEVFSVAYAEDNLEYRRE